MPQVLRLTFRFHDSVYHGRSEGGEPEWPPSPLRVFQALVASAASRWPAGNFCEIAIPAFVWLQPQLPEIVAPEGRQADRAYRLYVPNNAADLVGAAWNRGKSSASIAEHRTEKDVRPTHLSGDTVHYLYPLPDGACLHEEVLKDAARSVTHLGWGIDMVAADAKVISQDEAEKLSGQLWQAVPSGGIPLRVPQTGTLDDLRRKHKAFLGRLSADGFRPVPPLTEFRIVHYRRTTDPPRRSCAAFSLLRTDASGFRAFATTRNASTVAAMLRHAADEAAKASRWPESDRAAIVLGHGEPPGNEQHMPVGPHRFAYLPLPSLEYRGGNSGNVVGAVRRALITSFGDGLDDQIAWTRRALSGVELTKCDSREPVAFLSSLPTSDKMVQRFLRDSSTWTSVTPVVLPGYDDPGHLRRRLRQGVDATEQRRLLQKLDERIDYLLRKAILQAGYSPTLAKYAELEWRDSAFLPGADLASRYSVANHLRKHSRRHLRINWRDSTGSPVTLPGPVCLGGGRYSGMGLMVGIDND